MVPDRPCKMQLMSVKHQNLLPRVNEMFTQYATLDDVVEMVEREFNEKISRHAVQTYKNMHWKRRLDRVDEQKRMMIRVAAVVGEEGLAAGVNAMIWESLQRMSVAELTNFKKVLNDGEKVN